VPLGEASQPIRTIEDLEKDRRLHPLQQAFLDHDAFQCAYCTSGMIMSGLALLEQNSNPSVLENSQFMQGNICRCGTYPRIVEAIQQAAKLMGKQGRSAVQQRKPFPNRSDTNFVKTRSTIFTRPAAISPNSSTPEIMVFAVASDALPMQESCGARRTREGELPKDITAWLHNQRKSGDGSEY
jgi:xanthine dehydrogenase iron-sulfur cluster and FAD-binding subunit A